MSEVEQKCKNCKFLSEDKKPEKKKIEINYKKGNLEYEGYFEIGFCEFFEMFIVDGSMDCQHFKPSKKSEIIIKNEIFEESQLF